MRTAAVRQCAALGLRLHPTRRLRRLWSAALDDADHLLA